MSNVDIVLILLTKKQSIHFSSFQKRCRQIRSKMVVAYTDETNMALGDVGQGISVLNKRNTTVSIGCSCVLRQSDMVESYVQLFVH